MKYSLNVSLLQESYMPKVLLSLFYLQPCRANGFFDSINIYAYIYSIQLQHVTYEMLVNAECDIFNDLSPRRSSSIAVKIKKENRYRAAAI